jgi:hypothetical protein
VATIVRRVRPDNAKDASLAELREDQHEHIPGNNNVLTGSQTTTSAAST